ncbi:MAG: flagellar basal body-associated FliL family protein [Parvularculaceae bacterium]
MSDVTPIKLDLDLSGAEGGAEDGADEAASKGKGLGLVPMIAAAVVAAGVAGGAAFVLAPGAPEVECVAAPEEGEAGEHGAASDEHGGEHADGHGDEHGDAAGEHGEEAAPCVPAEHDEKKDKHDKKEKKKSGGGHGGGDEAAPAAKPIGQVQHTEDATFLVLEPMIVSIQPIGRARHLKISLVFETDDDGAEELIDRGFYIQDVLNTFLRSVDSTVLEDPASMTRLRSQILRRVKSVAPDANVGAVLITEFVLT